MTCPPTLTQTCDGQTLAALRVLAAHPKCVAIGECGLDFNRNFSPQDIQEIYEGTLHEHEWQCMKFVIAFLAQSNRLLYLPQYRYPTLDTCELCSRATASRPRDVCSWRTDVLQLERKDGCQQHSSPPSGQENEMLGEKNRRYDGGQLGASRRKVRMKRYSHYRT